MEKGIMHLNNRDLSFERWKKTKPDVGKIYYYISFDFIDPERWVGDPVPTSWRNNTCDENRLRLGNVFQTKEEAYKFQKFLYDRVNNDFLRKHKSSPIKK